MTNLFVVVIFRLSIFRNLATAVMNFCGTSFKRRKRGWNGEDGKKEMVGMTRKEGDLKNFLSVLFLKKFKKSEEFVNRVGLSKLNICFKIGLYKF